MATTTTNTPVEVARKIFDALHVQDLDTMQSYAHPDVRDDFVAIGVLEGAAPVRAFFAELFSAFPDFDIQVVHLVGDDEHAVVQWRARGTFTGTPFQGIHATGRSVELRGCDVMHFEGGKLKRNTIYYDGLGFARQVGMLPKEGSAADKAMTAAFNATTDLRARISRKAS